MTLSVLLKGIICTALGCMSAFSPGLSIKNEESVVEARQLQNILVATLWGEVDTDRKLLGSAQTSSHNPTACTTLDFIFCCFNLNRHYWKDESNIKQNQWGKISCLSASAHTEDAHYLHLFGHPLSLSCTVFHHFLSMWWWTCQGHIQVIEDLRYLDTKTLEFENKLMGTSLALYCVFNCCLVTNLLLSPFSSFFFFSS